MKINTVKFIFAIAMAALLGFICEIIAPETDGRNWISLGMGFITIASALIPAIGLTFNNANRGVNIKIVSWILSIALFASNIIFACFEYKVDIYIAVDLLISVAGWIIIFGLYSAEK